MTQHHEISLHDMISPKEALDAAGIDPDFDNEYQELEWEFACLRLECSDQ